MIEAVIKSLIYFGVLKLLQPKNPPEERPEMDWWSGFAIMLAAVVLVAISMIGIKMLALPAVVSLVPYIFYFLIPFVYFKYLVEFSMKEALVYGFVGLLIGVSVDFIIGMLLGVAQA